MTWASSTPTSLAIVCGYFAELLGYLIAAKSPQMTYSAVVSDA